MKTDKILYENHFEKINYTVVIVYIKALNVKVPFNLTVSTMIF
jgi:hypothetical protein